MEILEAMRRRRSIRGFSPDPVSREIIEKILDAAVRAPSAMNSQPWEFLALAGEVLDTLRAENIRLLRSGVLPQPEHDVAAWPRDSVYRDRQVSLAKGLFSLMGIAREDKEARKSWLERGFRYFDAPAAVIILTDKALSQGGPLLDLGAVMQNICLAAMDFGLGTCIEDQGVMYPQSLRKIAGVPESKRIVIAVAIGRPDPDFPANRLESERVPAKDITTWMGF